MPQDRRANQRVPVSLNVKLRLPDGHTTSTELISNISLGGVFIEMQEPLAFGVEVVLEFSLPSPSRTIRCKGFVVWSTRSHPDRAPGKQGVGIRLTDIGIADMRVLNEFIASQLKF
jgi:uncharacterized protein (TIGR02266 family)